MPHEIFHQIFNDPAADNRIIGHNQNRNHRIDPAAQRPPFGCSKCLISAHRTLSGHTTQRRFRHNHGIAKGQRQDNIDQQKNTATIFGSQIGKSPDVAQSHRCAGCRQHKSDFAGKRASFILPFFHTRLFSSHVVSNAHVSISLACTTIKCNCQCRYSLCTLSFVDSAQHFFEFSAKILAIRKKPSYNIPEIN